MSLLENALNSITIGIEDYQSDDPKRINGAVRNIYSGVLLLGKQCLLSTVTDIPPMHILSAKYEPTLDKESKFQIIPTGNQTIDIYKLKERFKNFNLSWPHSGDINRLQKIRNDLEHFHSKDPKNKIRDVIAESFPMIEHFFKILELEPHEQLGETWQVMLKEKRFYSKKMKECLESFKRVSWPVTFSLEKVGCPACTSSLIKNNSPEEDSIGNCEIFCLSCGEEINAIDFVEIYINLNFEIQNYSLYKDLNLEIIHTCPECFENTYITGTEDLNLCFLCNFSLKECASCSEDLTPENVSADNSSFCAYCEYKHNKDD